MKFFFLYIILFASWRVLSQSPFGTALVKGSLTMNIDETFEEYCDGILSKKEEIKEQYSTDLTGIVTLDKNDIYMIKKYPSPLGLRGTKLIMNNFKETLPEGAVLWESNKYNVPRFDLQAKYEKKVYGHDPCRNDRECESDFQAVLNYKETCSGIASHHGHPGAIVSCSVEGIETSGKYFFLSFDMGGFSWIENETVDNVHISGESSRLEGNHSSDGCKQEWKKDEVKHVIYCGFNPQHITVSKTDKGDGNWFGLDGNLKKNEKSDEAGNPGEAHGENLLMKIDTGAFFKYVTEKPALQTFFTTGSTSYITQDVHIKTIRTKRYTASLTLGKKSSFTIEAQDEEAYKNWLPGHPDYPGSNKPLSIKAKFDESSQQKDTIRFSIFDSSHLPGICTNYPVLPENPPKEPADIYFAPQDQQTDPNIKILDDSTAVTTKLVKEAVVVLISRDFGGYAKIRAVSGTSGETAECPVDGKPGIAIPYDQNDNKVADKWEKDMGIEGADKLEDKDKLPAGQGREGDGLTVFEEYRGFICEKDLEASCDAGHMQREGKHVRTSPLGRDAFIYDADGLFEKYVAPSNPAECHWHYVNREQLKLPPQDQVSQVVKANENDYPQASDKSASANTIRADLDNANNIMKTWSDKEYRRINANTPAKFRNNQQYGLHLLLSPVASTVGGVTISPDNKSAQSPLRYTHLVVLPQFSVLKARMMGIMSMLMLNSTHKTLWDKYPLEAQEKVVQTAYEAMVPHEVGHGLGIPHHNKGTITVITSKTKEKFVISGSNVGTINIPESKGDCNEVFYFDGQEYLTTGFQQAFIAMGVTECCMRYTVEREVDFVEKKVLTPSLKYCRKGQTFTDGNGKKTPADDCFSKILIRCIN